jgi:hypothetical protein
MLLSALPLGSLLGLIESPSPAGGSESGMSSSGIEESPDGHNQLVDGDEHDSDTDPSGGGRDRSRRDAGDGASHKKGAEPEDNNAPSNNGAAASSLGLLGSLGGI